MSRNDEWTVGRYLATRLEQLGIRYLFGVPGDFLGPFLTIMHDTTSVRWVGTPTEIGAGYAADAYARVRASEADLASGEQGVAAVAVTYGVGSFSLLNPVGGAYVEYVPVIVINAAPSYEQWLNYQAVGLLTSHMSQRRESNLEVYRQVTVDAQVLSNPGLAPSQIDSAIIAGLTERRPVYLEVMDDLWNAPCAAPQGELRRQERPFTKRNEAMLAKAVEASVELVERFGTPVLWAGEEIQRNRLERELVSLVELTGIPFCTTVGAKSVVSENTPGFMGVYNGKASLPEVRKAFKAAGCRIGLGTWSTSKNLAGEKSIDDDWIVAAREGVSVGAQYFPEVQLARFIPALRDALGIAFGKRAFETDLFALAHAEDRNVPASTAAFLTGLSAEDYPEELTYDGFFQHVDAFLLSQAQGVGTEATSPFSVISDAAFALLGSMNLQIVERGGFLAQNSWLSIGYSVGAATGVALAHQQPLKRPLVFVGDGSFQEVCQELSTHVRHHLRPVVFVLDNEGFYGIEQMLISPCYYKDRPSDGADFYNVLHPWRYEKLAEVFGSEKDRMHGRELTTHTELEALLSEIADPADEINHGPILARVRLSRHDYPRALQYKIDESCP
ncbi:alpha-keto acid decarboxylase family protein [Streptomyces sp. FH025]|uniref:alpha-keto acid decarboxylase family protein n=1 Tax=Streptomyces sp. FH025 TaxID=2815937 RepID=UPI001A9FED95|nr:thiamine pyrophosphate-binding protein [Streptomyces sp. FH025]MBO1418274.1 alpha-keto acid decarboxylase family protein [Streptomyces sp. FH025]